MLEIAREAIAAGVDAIQVYQLDPGQAIVLTPPETEAYFDHVLSEITRTLLIENALPPLRPASVARTWSLEKLRFSSRARSLPLRAISRYLSSSIEAKPRLGMLRLLAIISLHRWKCRHSYWKLTAGFRNSRNTRSIRTLPLI